MIRAQSLRYGKAFKPLRRIFKYVLSSFIYPLVKWALPLPKVLSIDETLDQLNAGNYSISRFGDGEFLLLVDKLSLPFQQYEPALDEKLRAILQSDEEGILVGLPSGYHGLKNLNSDSQLMWRSHIAWSYPRIRPLFNLKKTYYNASFTRFYYELEDKSPSTRYLTKIQKLWKDQEVLIIEGEKSRLGVGNDLFFGAKQIQRILGPKHNAFSKYDALKKSAEKYGKGKLILIALGPTATALSYDLALSGYRAIDIGNVDIEYEWYLKKAQTKERVVGKYTSEVLGGRSVGECYDEVYLSQIIEKFI